MKVFLSAYACEPGKGSEPGVGWRWATGLSEQVELTVVTRSNNRPGIEREILGRPPDDPIHGVLFIYHDLPAPLIRLKNMKLLGTLPYYFLWQWSIARRLRKEANEADVVHHLTFCTALCPGFWNRTKSARVIGPVAAPLVNPHYLPLFGVRRPIQSLRGWLVRHFLKLPWLKRSFLGAAAVIPANSEAKELLESLGITCEPVMLDTGAPEPNHRPSPAGHDTGTKDEACRFIYAGVLERRKGLELALKAFAEIAKDGDNSRWSFEILGSGPDRTRLEALAGSLGIGHSVRFHGVVPHTDMQRHFMEADVFVFTSVRDTSGGVNLEAMAAGLPVLCIAHQGVGDITNDTCAIRIAPDTIESTIRALATGIRRLIADPDLRESLGKEARNRALNEFLWEGKFGRMMEIYDKARFR